MKKILFVVDVLGWAYDEQAKTWKRLLEGEFDIDIIYLSNFPVGKYSSEFNMLNRDLINGKNFPAMLDSKPEVSYEYGKIGERLRPVFDHKEYDGLVFFYHKAIADSRLLATPFPLRKVAVCINNEKWVTDGAKHYCKHFYSKVKILVGCNKYIVNTFSRFHPNVMRVSQAIDNSVFFYDKGLCKRKKNHQFTVGWCGNSNNPIKNVKHIRRACEDAEVRLSIKQSLSRKDLNIWYNNVDLIVSASKSEGGPMMLLEAGAIGVPVITTNTGLAREIIKSGVNGMIISHKNVSEMTQVIMKMKQNRGQTAAFARFLQKEVLRNWTYEARLDEIRAVLNKL